MATCYSLFSPAVVKSYEGDQAFAVFAVSPASSHSHSYLMAFSQLIRLTVVVCVCILSTRNFNLCFLTFCYCLTVKHNLLNIEFAFKKLLTMDIYITLHWYNRDLLCVQSSLFSHTNKEQFVVSVSSSMTLGQERLWDRTTNSSMNGYPTVPTEPHRLLVQRLDKMHNFFSDQMCNQPISRSIRARGSVVRDWCISFRNRTEDEKERQQCCLILTQPVSLHCTLINKRPFLHLKYCHFHSNRTSRQQPADNVLWTLIKVYPLCFMEF